MHLDFEVKKVKRGGFSGRNMTFRREDNDLYTNYLQ